MLLVCEGYYVGDSSKAAAALGLIERASDPMPYAHTLAKLATVQMLAGDVVASDESFRRVEAFLGTDAAIGEVEYLEDRVTSLLLLARIGEATSAAERLMALTDTMGAHLRTHGLQSRSSVAMATGDWALTRTLGQETARIVEANPETPYCIRGAMASAHGAAGALMQGDPHTAEDLVALSERMIRPGLQRSYAILLPSVMLGRHANPAEAMPSPGAIRRPWEHQHVDPGYLSLTIGAVIADRTDVLPALMDHLRQFGEKGSKTTSALAEAVGGDPESLRTMGFVGLVALLSYRSSIPALHGATLEPRDRSEAQVRRR